MESTARAKLSGQTTTATTQYIGTTYYLLSSVLGRTISELDINGNRRITNIYCAGVLLAKQQKNLYNQNDEIVWTHTDPQTGSALNTFQSGAAVAISHKEYDPLGNGVLLYDLGESEPNIDARPAYEEGSILNSSSGRVWPDSGEPAPCEVVALAENWGVFKRDRKQIPRTSTEEAKKRVQALMRAGHLGTGDSLERAGSLVQATDETDNLLGIVLGADDEIGQSQKPWERRLSKEEYLALRKEMAKALQSEKCGNFIDTLVTYNSGQPFDSGEEFLAISDYIFNSKDGGIFWASGDGIQVGHKLKIGPGLRPDLNVRIDAATLMHELIHGLQGRGSDDQLDRDLRGLGIVPKDSKGQPLPFPTGKRNGVNFNDWSGFWDQALHNACFP